MRIPICVALGVTTILFGILGVNACCMVHVGSGERNGIVVKLADEGFFKKTHELEDHPWRHERRVRQFRCETFLRNHSQRS